MRGWPKLEVFATQQKQKNTNIVATTLPNRRGDKNGKEPFEILRLMLMISLRSSISHICDYSPRPGQPHATAEPRKQHVILGQSPREWGDGSK